MPELILDDAHTYRLDGKVLDGLTLTIAEAGLIRGLGDAWYLTRGTAIHKATEFYDKKTLDESTVDTQIQGYLESWRRFRKDQNYTPTHIEYQIYHPELMVATTIDRLPGPLDLKSGGPEPWHVLQVGFQWGCLKALYYNGHPLSTSYQKPMDVYLDPDGGPPKIKVYSQGEMRESFKVYCSMLHFLRWKREKGVK